MRGRPLSGGPEATTTAYNAAMGRAFIRVTRIVKLSSPARSRRRVPPMQLRAAHGLSVAIPQPQVRPRPEQAPHDRVDERGGAAGDSAAVVSVVSISGAATGSAQHGGADAD